MRVDESLRVGVGGPVELRSRLVSLTLSLSRALVVTGQQGRCVLLRESDAGHV